MVVMSVTSSGGMRGAELAIDWTTPNGSKLSGILAYH
jgi:hypothetical protein